MQACTEGLTEPLGATEHGAAPAYFGLLGSKFEANDIQKEVGCSFDEALELQRQRAAGIEQRHHRRFQGQSMIWIC
jgi:hypothetical protein